MPETDDLLIQAVAHVNIWAAPPDGLPRQHPYYTYDSYRGWWYLTQAGRQFRLQHLAEVRSYERIYQEQVATWAQASVEELLADFLN